MAGDTTSTARGCPLILRRLAITQLTVSLAVTLIPTVATVTATINLCFTRPGSSTCPPRGQNSLPKHATNVTCTTVHIQDEVPLTACGVLCSSEGGLELGALLGAQQFANVCRRKEAAQDTRGQTRGPHGVALHQAVQAVTRQRALVLVGAVSKGSDTPTGSNQVRLEQVNVRRRQWTLEVHRTMGGLQGGPHRAIVACASVAVDVHRDRRQGECSCRKHSIGPQPEVGPHVVQLDNCVKEVGLLHQQSAKESCQQVSAPRVRQLFRPHQLVHRKVNAGVAPQSRRAMKVSRTMVPQGQRLGVPKGLAGARRCCSSGGWGVS